MDDIARLAGVSASTVSRALSDSPLVAERTKARIREIAARFDYQVDPSARSLRLRKTGIIAVVVPLKTEQPLSDPFFLELLGAIADALTERGYQMLLARVPSVAEITAHSLVNPGRADGVILVGQSTEHTAIDNLSRRVDPLVVWGHQIPGQHYPTVGSDNIAGGRAAGEHFLRSGHRRIAFLGDPDLPEVRARLDGIQRAFEVHGRDPGELIVHASPFIGSVAHERARALLADHPAVDAIFAASDLLAISAVSAARALERRVPEDLAVIGFDDIQIAAYYHPSLSTVRQDIRQGGHLLVERLFARLRGEPVSSTVLPVELILRQSTRLPEGDEDGGGRSQ